jgi:hypothetical protein
MSAVEPDPPRPHVSRRQVLKVGAAVGTAAWAAPVISVIGAGPASAHTPSPERASNSHGSCKAWPALPTFYVVCRFAHSRNYGLIGLCLTFDPSHGKYTCTPYGADTKDTGAKQGFARAGYWSDHWGVWSRYSATQPHATFEPADSGDCNYFSSAKCFDYRYDKNCKEQIPIRWRPPQGCYDVKVLRTGSTPTAPQGNALFQQVGNPGGPQPVTAYGGWYSLD